MKVINFIIPNTNNMFDNYNFDHMFDYLEDFRLSVSWPQRADDDEKIHSRYNNINSHTPSSFFNKSVFLSSSIWNNFLNLGQLRQEVSHYLIVQS